MKTLTCILLDVSGSMRDNAGGEIEEENCDWARSTFEVIENFVKYDVSLKNHIFALGVGAKYGKGIFDVLKTIERFDKNEENEDPECCGNDNTFTETIKHAVKNTIRDVCKELMKAIPKEDDLRKAQSDPIPLPWPEPAPDTDSETQSMSVSEPKSKTKPLPVPHKASFDDLIEQFFKLVEKNGAPRTRKWTSKETIKSAIPYETANLLIKALKSSKEFLQEFVIYCLPLECKQEQDEALTRKAKLLAASFIGHQASVEEINGIAEKAMGRLLKDVGSVFTIQRASDILHGCIDINTLTKDRINELMTIVRPIIFGGTPMYEALNKATEIFQKVKYSDYKKLMFVLSDGQPTDDDVYSVVEKLKGMKVTIVCCLITRSGNIKPRRLYSVENSEWSNGAKLLFKLSSTVPSQLLPRTIFIKKGWNIDIKNNETKLFLHVNHHGHIHDACNLARNVVCCQDSLADLLVSVSLDIYIYQNTSTFTAKRQVRGTCYANALAAVLHLSMKRILGRDNGYPSFIALRDEMIDRHGEDGAYTLKVLTEITPRYRLHYEAVDITEAMSAIASKRPVFATFSLTDLEWEQFGEFYRRYPTGILTKAEIDLSKRDPRAKRTGHAVVLTSFDSECLRFMNSWGDNWADMGFFRVQNSKVLDIKFIDVFWTLNDLSEREIEYFKKHGAEVADKIMKSLKSLQKAKYECPKCSEISLVTEFSGSLKEAVCPKCNGKFRSDEAGNILALNMYLTSLSK